MEGHRMATWLAPWILVQGNAVAVSAHIDSTRCAAVPALVIQCFPTYITSGVPLAFQLHGVTFVTYWCVHLSGSTP